MNTKICTLNLSIKDTQTLKRNEIDVFEGSLGQIIRLEYGMYNNSITCKPNYLLPKNLHEYDVVVIDLTYEDIVVYNNKKHGISGSGKSSSYDNFICYDPQDLFDPRAYLLDALNSLFKGLIADGAIIIVFCSAYEEIFYRFRGSSGDRSERINIYSFLDDFPNHNNKHGENIKLAKIEQTISPVIKKHLNAATYHIIFHHPYIYQRDKTIHDPDFLPLLVTNKDEVVAFSLKKLKSNLFFFPDISDKGSFLSDFLKEVAPTVMPELFPDIIKNSWLTDSKYALPNKEALEDEKASLQLEYETKLSLKEQEIGANQAKYSFLTDLITETGDALVAAVVVFFKWLGFDSAVEADSYKETGEVLEEDIQIETDRGLIIIEIKGIGGTSTDAACSQIGKIRFRRAKQRAKFDVFPHYIVNHQRHLPAADRNNPPFTSHQLSDAKNDERGLSTTWQLFNLYKIIENGDLTKEEVRESFFENGYLQFLPKNMKFLGQAKELFKGNTVTIINFNAEPKLHVGDRVIAKYEMEIMSLKVKSIKMDGDVLMESQPGELGVSFDKPIKKGSQLYY